MAKKKLSRKELLRNTDEFLTLSGKAALFVNQHMHQVKMIGIGLAVIGIAYLAVWGYMKHINKAGQEAYNEAYDALVQNQQPEEGYKEGVKKSEALFEDVINDYGMSKAAALALPQVGHAKFITKEYDGAIEYYREFSSKAAEEQDFETLNLLALAACHEAKGELKEAAGILKGVVENPDNPFRESALLNLERIYRLDNQPEKAKELLKTFAKDYASSPFYPIVKARL